MGTTTTPEGSSDSSHQGVPTGLQLTALDERFRNDPYPVLAELRSREPVHRDTVLNRIVLTRHDDVHAVLRDLEMWSDPRKGNPGTFAREFLDFGDDEPSMLLMDDPGHKRLRALVRKTFTPKAIERWRPRVREVAERIITTVGDEEFDLIERVAGPIPTVVIAELLGIDPEMHDAFKSWSDTSVVVAFNPAAEPQEQEAAAAAGAELDEFFRREIAARRRSPGEDLISGLLASEEDGDRLSEVEIIQMCNLLLIAGNVTTTDLIGNGMKALVHHTDQLAKLRHRPELISNAVEEMLRFDSPVTNSGRIAHRDLTMGGVKIEKGETLSVSLAAANRDPDAYPEPDAFEIERADTHHQAFGGGRHFCLGAHLARIEAQEAVLAMLQRFAHLGPAERGCHYAAIPSFRAMKELWLTTAH
jgi:cytochrome P450